MKSKESINIELLKSALRTPPDTLILGKERNTPVNMTAIEACSTGHPCIMDHFGKVRPFTDENIEEVISGFDTVEEKEEYRQRINNLKEDLDKYSYIKKED